MFDTPQAYEYKKFTQTNEEYRIKPYDNLDIRIFYNNGYSLLEMQQQNNANNVIEYNVEQDGFVKLPQVGRIKVEGLTVREAEKLLEEKYKDFLVDPFVKIKVTNKRVIVFTNGSSSAKVLPFKNEQYSLVEALADAGGIGDQSKAYRIKLLRGNLQNPEIFVFNLRNINNFAEYNFNLQSNDIIYVEARPRYASKIITEIAPYLSLLSTALIIYSLFK
jgi:polysaccharide export outer membrane protein